MNYFGIRTDKMMSPLLYIIEVIFVYMKRNSNLIFIANEVICYILRNLELMTL